MTRAMNWRATLLWVVLCVLLSGPALANEKVVFQCDFDEAVAPGSNDGKLVFGRKGGRSRLGRVDVSLAGHVD